MQVLLSPRAIKKTFARCQRSDKSRYRRCGPAWHLSGKATGYPFGCLGLVQLKNPTGALKTELPEGTLAFRFAPSSLGDDAKQIIREQKNKGYTLPSNMVVVGLPLGTTHKDGTEWKNLKLADGRIVSISVSGLTKTKTISDIGVRYLLNESGSGVVIRIETKSKLMACLSHL